MGRPRTEAPPPPTPESNPPYPPPSPSLYSTQNPQEPPAPYPPTAKPPYPPPPQPVAYPPPSPTPPQFNPLQATAGPQPPVFVSNASMGVAAPGIPVQLQLPQQYPPPTGMPGRVGPPGTAYWTTGLFDCRDDPMNAVMTFFFPCVTFGQIAEIVDDGRSACSTSGMMYGCVAFLIALPCLISCGYRTRLRAKFDLVEAPAPDWATHFLCECCALCQEYRELRNRGLDPAIGWHANIAKMQGAQQGVVMAPPMNQFMTG